MHRGAWGATVHGVEKSRTRLSVCGHRPGDPLPGRSLPSVNGPNPGGFCSVGPSASGLPLEVLYLGGSWGCPSLSLGQAQELDGGWEEEADGWAWNPSSPPALAPGRSPSGQQLPRCPRTRAPVSAPFLGKQQAFLSLSP